MNKSVAAARRHIARRGGTVLATRESGKHTFLHICTAEGAVFWFKISRGSGNDPYKDRQWERQALARAEARNVVERRERRKDR